MKSKLWKVEGMPKKLILFIQIIFEKNYLLITRRTSYHCHCSNMFNGKLPQSSPRPSISIQHFSFSAFCSENHFYLQYLNLQYECRNWLEKNPVWTLFIKEWPLLFLWIDVINGNIKTIRHYLYKDVVIEVQSDMVLAQGWWYNKYV